MLSHDLISDSYEWKSSESDGLMKSNFGFGLESVIVVERGDCCCSCVGLGNDMDPLGASPSRWPDVNASTDCGEAMVMMRMRPVCEQVSEERKGKTDSVGSARLVDGQQALP